MLQKERKPIYDKIALKTQSSITGCMVYGLQKIFALDLRGITIARLFIVVMAAATMSGGGKTIIEFRNITYTA